MRINVKSLFLMVLALQGVSLQAAQMEPISKSYPKPRVFINEWENLTNHEIVIYTGAPYSQHHVATLKPGQKILLNREIIPQYALGPKYDIYARHASGPQNYLQMDAAYYPNEHRIELGVYGFGRPSPQEFSFGPGEDIANSIIRVNVIAKGDNFEQSTLSAVKTGTAKTMREQSLHNVARQIKKGKLSLEKAKKMLPADLHEDLERVLASE